MYPDQRRRSVGMGSKKRPVIEAGLSLLRILLKIRASIDTLSPKNEHFLYPVFPD